MNKINVHKFLTNEEIEQLHTKADYLKADLTFFEMYLERNKMSNFCFEVVPVPSNRIGKLMKRLYTESYTYMRNELHQMLCEVEIAKAIAWQLSGREESGYADDDIKNAYKYFREMHEIDLLEYIGDFIGCSSTTEAACKKLKEIVG